jgi:hypothetical protein
MGFIGEKALTTEAQSHREKRKKIPEPFIAESLFSLVLLCASVSLW